ncbi:hypothetical protein FJ656_23785, partial [Schumannella luteola]
TPLYNWDRNGSFEAYLTDDDGYVLRQQVDRDATGVGGAWNGGDPITGIGDRRWTNYRASVDVRFETGVASDNYAALGARSSGGGSSNNLNGTPYAIKLGSDGGWQFLRYGQAVSTGTLGGADWDAAAWHALSLRVAGDRITAWVDGEQLADWTDPAAVLSGYVDLASGFHYTWFDDLEVERVDGYTPYYGEYLDGLETYDLTAARDAKLVYEGSWALAMGADMYTYQRTTAKNTAPGASVSYGFTGSGLDVIGVNDGSAKLAVTVDGTLIQAAAATRATGSYQQTFTLRGLPYGTHTVRLEVVAGTLNVDAVGVVSSSSDVAASAGALADAVTAGRVVAHTGDFTDGQWQLLQDVIAMGQAAVDDPAGYRLDAEGAGQLAERIRAASHPLAARIASIAPVSLATYTGSSPALPATVVATLTDGTTREIPVTWDSGAQFDTAWSTVVVTGRYGSASTEARIEVVPPGTVAFADVNATAGGALGYDSPSYAAISALTGGLLNPAPDQVLQGDATWGHGGRTASGATSISYKGVVAGPYDKTTTTGMYTANQVGAEVSYTFTLAAGRYSIAAGSYSWWPGNSRSEDVILRYDGEDHAVDAVTLDGGTPGRVLAYDIDLAADGPVTLILRATNAQSPMLSWAAAVAGEYAVTYALNGGTGGAPAARDGLLWTDAGLDAADDAFARPLYTFAGWNTEPDGTGLALDADTTVAQLVGDPAVHAVTLYAQWRPVPSGWSPSTVYTAGDTVSRGDRIFFAQWWTKGELPGSTPWGAWSEFGAWNQCASGDVQDWTPTWIYTGGEKVVFDGKVWTARWWTRNQAPDATPWGPWTLLGTC